MPDSTVSKWKQSGLVYLWRYLENTRNYPGWHLKTDEAGRQSLLGLLQEMHAAKYSSRATVHLSAPTMRQLSVPNNRHGQAAHRAAEEWLIVYPKGRTPDQTWQVSVEASRVVLTMGQATLDLLIEGLKTQGFDYSIPYGDETQSEERLWFW